MISFNDKSLYAKGTCNVLVSNPQTYQVLYQSNKAQSGNITASTNLNEIRAGLGNPIVAMIPSDAGLSVDFTMADFNMIMKARQLGATHTYSAPVWKCVTATADGTTLTVDVATNGIPQAALGMVNPVAFVQEIGAASLTAADGAAYEITPAGVISGFSATAGAQYKVWYHAQNVSAEVATIGSAIDPAVVRFEAQMAVYCNNTGTGTQGTRVGWLYVIIPYLKLQADATVTGDQGTADTTKVSGQAIAYDQTVVSATCTECDSSNLGYYVYVPDDASENIVGLTVVGGVTSVAASSSDQLPILFVMADGSTVRPMDYATGFTYTLDSAPAGTSISASGVITAGAKAGDCDCTVTYAAGEVSLSNISTISVVSA